MADVEIDPIDRSQMQGLDIAAQALMQAYRPQLVLVIAEPHIICIPGGNGDLSATAKALRQIADALDKTHSNIGGLTLAEFDQAQGKAQA